MKTDKMRTGAFAVFCAAAMLMAAAPNANAQDPRRGYNVGVGASGTDMWTQSMSGLRLFTPHRNNCDDTTTPTEVFVKTYTNSNSIDFGYCIDIDEHSAGVIQWEDARKACLDDGKRLPEPGEFKYSCDSTTGLNNMTDDWEWTTNFSQSIWKSAADYRNGPTAIIMGSGSCKKGAHGWIASTATYSDTFAFRCVR